MFKAILATGTAVLFLLSGLVEPVEASDPAGLDLEPAINGAVSANGLFPSQAMEEEFAAYLLWTKDRGISRLFAFESMFGGGTAQEVPFPNPRMTAQFEAYLRWVDNRNISPFYAFMVTNFD
jgi:hypothetical protein